jgi:hypothetical protein
VPIGSDLLGMRFESGNSTKPEFVPDVSGAFSIEVSAIDVEVISLILSCVVKKQYVSIPNCSVTQHIAISHGRTISTYFMITVNGHVIICTIKY